MKNLSQSRDLFLPASLGPITLSNRIVMAPLTRSRADKEGVVSDLTAIYYSQRASAGLIISEAIATSAMAHGYAWTPGLYSEAQIKAWGRVTRTVKRNEGHIFAQLWHGGRVGHSSMTPNGARRIAPSAVRAQAQAFTYQGMQDMEIPRELSIEEIEALVQEFAQAAVNARKAGFDGVELHGANGYLIDQFLKDKSNRRTDAYGGTIERRCRFGWEVAQACADAIGAGRVGIRISPLNPFNDVSDQNPRELFRHFVSGLSEIGLAYLHVIEEVPQFTNDPRYMFNMDELRPLFHGAYMVNGGYDLRRAEMSIDAGRADFVSFGRAFIANPDLVQRLATGAPIAEPDRTTYYGGGAEGYIDYPKVAEA